MTEEKNNDVATIHAEVDRLSVLAARKIVEKLAAMVELEHSDFSSEHYLILKNNLREILFSC